MGIEIQENNDINYDINRKNTIKKNGTNFADALNSALSYSKNTQSLDKDKDILKISENIVNEKTGISTIDNLPEKNNTDVKSAMKDLNNILGLNPYNYFKEDSTIDIRKMIQDFVNSNSKLSFNSLSRLSKSIDTLYKNGLIDDDSYIYAILWIKAQMQALKMIEKAEDTVIAVFDEIDKPKENLKDQK